MIILCLKLGGEERKGKVPLMEVIMVMVVAGGVESPPPRLMYIFYIRLLPSQLQALALTSYKKK